MQDPDDKNRDCIRLGPPRSRCQGRSSEKTRVREEDIQTVMQVLTSKGERGRRRAGEVETQNEAQL